MVLKTTYFVFDFDSQFPNIIVSKFNRRLTRKKIITTKQNKNIAINFLDRQILQSRADSLGFTHKKTDPENLKRQT